MSLKGGVFPTSNEPEIAFKVVHDRRMKTIMKLDQLTTIEAVHHNWKAHKPLPFVWPTANKNAINGYERP